MKTFLNLTNGLLWDGNFDGFIRIQSCHCEQKKWDKVIQTLDNNFLMWLAMGHEIQVVDYSNNKDVPRALYQGLVWTWFACQKTWLQPIDKPMVRKFNAYKYFTEEYEKLSSDSIKKLKYFRKFLNNPKKPSIISGRTDKDGEYDFFTDRAKQL